MEMNPELERDDASESGKSKSTAGSSVGSIFCSLERDYAKLLHEMSSNEALTPYRSEYTRLFEALYNCHQEEEQLGGKLRILQEEAIVKTNKILELEQIIESQKKTIQTLNEEIVDTSKLADAAHTREQSAQGIIENLRLTIVKLNNEIEQKNRTFSMDESVLNKQQNGNSLKDNERLMNEIETLKQRIQSMSVYTAELEKKIVAYDEQVIKNQEQMDVQSNEILRERTIREKIEKELHDIRNELEVKKGQLQATNVSMKITLNNSNKLENTITELKNANEKLRKDVSRLMASEMNLQTELDHSGKHIDKLKIILEEKSNEYKILTLENKKLKREVTKYIAQNDNAMSKYSKSDIARAEIEKNLRHTEHMMKSIEAEMTSYQRQIAEEQRVTETVIRDKNAILKTVQNMKDEMKKIHQQMNMSENTKRRIRSELDDMVEMNRVMNKRLQVTEKEKEKYSEQINSLTQQVKECAAEIKHKDKEILDYRKELSLLSSKLQKQQNLFESVTSERNMHIKSLAAAQDEIQDLRDKLKLLNGQIEHMKEDTIKNLNTINKGEFWLKKLEQDNEKTKLELKNSQRSVDELRQTIVDLKKMEKQYRDTIKTTNTDIAHLKKQIDHVMNDRDILGTQLVRRNDELSLLYSKIKILHETLSRGESEYSKRLEDIKLLTLKVNKLTGEKAILSKSLKNMSDLRHETYHLNRDLTEERLKVTALEEDLQNPLNIHRWRKLQGSEPNTSEMLKKIQILQKRIIKMSKELILKSKKVNETETLYMDLREIILKQPGPELLSTFTQTKKILQRREQMIKSLIAEREMLEQRSNENSSKFEKANTDLLIMQKKYYALKRKVQKISSQTNTDCMLPALSANHKKYCGGGFTMLIAPSRNTWSIESK